MSLWCALQTIPSDNILGSLTRGSSGDIVKSLLEGGREGEILVISVFFFYIHAVNEFDLLFC